MKSALNQDLRARILHSALRSSSASEALDLLQGSGALEPALPANRANAIDGFLRDLSIEEDSGSQVREWIDASVKDLPQEWREFAFTGLILKHAQAPRGRVFTRLEELLATGLDAESYCWVLLRVQQAGLMRAGGKLPRADVYLKEAEQRVRDTEHPLLRDLCDAPTVQGRGLYAQATGDYSLALQSLDRALSLSEEYQLRLLPIVSSNLASLHWASGQAEKAMKLHLSADTRDLGGRRIGSSWLIRSHLSAAKCAIDCEEFLVADMELRAARQLLRETTSPSALLMGYQKLYAGELILRSHESGAEQGFDRIEEACQIFEAEDPQHHAGLLEAKITIAQHAIRSDDHRRMFIILHKILEEASELGCLEARARALVFESSLFVSETPPIREAYDDLVTRLHLINNPALLMQALSNLFVHSLRYLELSDQAFLMARLRRLQTVLDESCFQDLYETYIEQRYSWAIENRLADLLEQEGSVFDSESGDPTK